MLHCHSGAFHTPGAPLSATHIAEHTIPLLNENEPVFVTPRQLGHSEVQQAKKLIYQLVEKGVVAPCVPPSAFNTPFLLVPKKTPGTFRLVSTFVKLNSASKLITRFPMVRIDDAHQSIRGMKIFGTADFQDGYFQVRIRSKDQHKTAFSSPQLGQFLYRRMSMGLSGSPSTFNFVISQALGHLRELQVDGARSSICVFFVDDILVASMTTAAHLAHWHFILTALKRANLVLSPTKTEILRSSVTFCGRLLSEKGISIPPDKLQKVALWPKPSTRSKMTAFLALVNHLSDHIPREKIITAPLRAMQTTSDSGRKKLQWSDEADLAWDEIQAAVASPTQLATPIYDRDNCPFIITTDASKFAVAATLSQEQPHGESFTRRIIAFASKALNATRSRYSNPDKEILASVFALEKFRRIIIGQRIRLESDLRALSDAFSSGNAKSARLSRWLAIVQAYCPEAVHHIAGKHNGLADALSRHPALNQSGDDLLGLDSWEQTHFDSLMSISELRDSTSTSSHDSARDDVIFVDRAVSILLFSRVSFLDQQGTDPFLSLVIKICRGEEITNEVDSKIRTSAVTLAGKCIIANDSLFLDTYPRPKLVIPAALRAQVLTAYHSPPHMGHYGQFATHQRITRDFWWPSVRADIARFISDCECKRHKVGPRLQSTVGQTGANALFPFHSVALDIKGPIGPHSTDSGNRYIISFVDIMSKWVEAYAVPNHDSHTVSRCFMDFVLRHGFVHRIYCDRGKEFVSSIFRSVLDRFGVKLSDTPPYSPWLQGPVERYHRTIGTILMQYLNKYGPNWDTVLPFALFAYRTAFHKAIKTSPFEFLYGQNPILPQQAQFESMDCDNDSRTYTERIAEAREVARQRNPALAQSAHPGTHRFLVGHHIVVKVPSSTRSKMAPRWSKPVCISYVAPDHSYIKYVNHRGNTLTANVDNVQLAFPSDPWTNPTSLWGQPDEEECDPATSPSASSDTDFADGRTSDLNTHGYNTITRPSASSDTNFADGGILDLDADGYNAISHPGGPFFSAASL